MSHFVVLVVGDDVEFQLAPFHEFETTGIDNEFVRDVDITAEVLKEMEEKEKSVATILQEHGYRPVEDESELDRAELHKYGYAVVKDGALIKMVKRTNPNDKWDWYVTGGRWSDWLGRSEGTKAEYDFESVRNKAAAEASVFWDKVRAVIGDETWESWDQCVASVSGDDPQAWQQRRDRYWKQSAILKLRADEDLRDVFIFNVDDTLVLPRDEYVAQKRKAAIVPYALVIGRNWIGRGDMGMFGMSSNEIDKNAWVDTITEYLDELPDDTKITVVDCHI